MFIELINITDLNDIEKCGSVSLPIYYTEFDISFLLYDKNFIIYKAVIDNKLTGFLVGKVDGMEHIHIFPYTYDPTHIHTIPTPPSSNLPIAKRSIECIFIAETT